VRSRPTTSAVARPLDRGFTLLEVLLTLSLTSMVLVALAMAIDFQLRVVERSRRNVEEAQLARVLMRRIADDLRGAVASDPTGMQELVEEAAFSAVSSTTESAGGSAEATGDAGGESSTLNSGEAEPSETEGEDSEGSASETSGSEDMAESESGETADADSLAEPSKPGVYGESDWIQVDVGRLPRIDQFEYQVTYTEDSTTADRLSDVKTVTYYVIPPGEGVVEYAVDGSESSGGLVRRELDRAAASWASDESQLDPTTDSAAEPLAPEVAAIEFRYSDGTEWVDSWDSDEAGALPVAVEITLRIAPFSNRNQPLSWSTSAELDATEEESWLTYRRVVHLPAAQASSGAGSDEDLYGEEDMETGESAEGTESSSMESGPDGEESSR